MNYELRFTTLYRKWLFNPCQRKRYARNKMVVWGGLTDSWEKKRSEKQRRKEKYSQLNAEFQRIVRRDKKAFLHEQCKEIKESNFFKKIRDTKCTFHEKMGTINDRNVMGLIEAEDAKKKWEEYTKELCKKMS